MDQINSKRPSAAGARELFRYARVFPPRILDLPARLASYPDTKPLAAGYTTSDQCRQDEVQAWAKQFVKTRQYVRDLQDLGLKVFASLKIDALPADRLPDRNGIADLKKFQSFLRTESKRLEEARRRVTLSMFASAQLGQKDVAARLSHALQFLELLPHLPATKRRSAYAPAVLKRYRRPAGSPPPELVAVNPTKGSESSPPKKPSASRDILNIWDLSNEYGGWKRRSLEAKIEAVKHRTFEFKPPEASGKAKEKISEKKLKSVRKRQYSAYIGEKTATFKALTAELKNVANTSVHERVAAVKADKEFQAYVYTTYGKDPVEVIDKVDVPEAPAGGFCEWYSKQKDRETGRPDEPRDCVYKSGDPCMEELAKDRQEVDGRDDVRPLGLAELVTVEERWMAYLPGEVSSIETILKGEVRKKEVKSTKFFEEVTEQMTQEVQDEELEKQSKTKQDLSSQVESELATRFNSDINASVSGSGGGTIGVVNLEGGASLGAGIGLGLDTRLSTSSESNFSQEIVSKAVERTKKVTSELRRSRTYQLFETSDYHEIDNTGNSAAHTNAIYCYLDKKICITERVYGIRKFLNAEIIRPGSDLVKKETQRHLLNLNEIGLPPTFDLSPTDITPENYLFLVGKFRASNVSPPPSSVKVVSKTYKTDITNENRDQNETNLKKIADVLTPFFGQYKRFLIQDNIDIPEGYRVQEVRVTVTHGSNGVSIPAHLPFSILGAGIFALPTIGVAAIPPYTLFYLPLAIWQVLYAASPLIHFNADSSNVTVNIGHQTEESPYFFFQPDFLIREIFDAIGNSSVITEAFIEFLRGKLMALYTAFTSTSSNGVIDALTDMSDEMKDAINTFITQLQNWLGTLVTSIIPSMIGGGSGSGPSLPSIPSISASVIAEIPKAILAPFQTFFNEVVAKVEDLMQDSLGDLFEYFITMLDNTDTKSFSGVKGFTDKLPVSFNCIGLKPGITINLSACMVRLDELALDAWRLETFDRLNQAYYQLVADYDSRRNVKGMKSAHRDSPGLMRQEEHEVIKNRVIRTLHQKYSATPDLFPSLDELQLFEHAIDWENVSFRLFNYGPSGLQIAHEKQGLFATVDERRRQFMNALWSQVLIPLREDERLEQVMIKFLQSGAVNFESDLLAELAGGDGDPLNELTEIYRDLVLQRRLLPEVEPVYRQEIIPTDLMVIYEPRDGEPYPVNSIGCGDDGGNP